jgi:hypothetical protein
MSWADFYRRRDSIDAALEHARQGRPGPMPLGVFSDEDELLLALHHKWLMALTGRVELALVEQRGDPVQACAAEHEVLRRVLDEHADRPALRPAIDGEHRLLALAARPRRNPVEHLPRRLAASA